MDEETGEVAERHPQPAQAPAHGGYGLRASGAGDMLARASGGRGSMTWGMRFLAGACVCLAVSWSLPSFANYYRRGYQVCEDFAAIKQNYENEPEFVGYEIAYAACLVLKGGPEEERGFEYAESSRGLQKRGFCRFFSRGVY